MLGLIHHMIVGHRITVSRNEEAGTLAQGVLASLLSRSLPLAKTRYVRLLAEAPEEILERRTAQRIVVIQRETVAARVHLDLDGDDRRLHLFHDVGEAHRPLGVLRMRRGRRKQCAAGRVWGQGEVREQQPAAQSGNGRKKEDAALGIKAMPRIPGHARRHISDSIC